MYFQHFLSTFLREDMLWKPPNLKPGRCMKSYIITCRDCSYSDVAEHPQSDIMVRVTQIFYSSACVFVHDRVFSESPGDCADFFG